MQTPYMKITVRYSSFTFDEILGQTDDGRTVAAFVLPGHYKNEYPISHNIIYISPECVFDIPSFNHHVIPYMRYGSIALFLQDMFPNNDFNLVCNKSIYRLLTQIINYKTPSSVPSSPLPTVTITHTTLIIDTQVINLDEGTVFTRERVRTAIDMTNHTNLILNKFVLQNSIHSPKSEYFFTVYEF